MFASLGPYQVSLLCWVIVCAILAFIFKVFCFLIILYIQCFIQLVKTSYYFLYLQIFYYTQMHLWKDNIISKVTQQYGSRKVVHRSENYWFLGELTTSETTLLILPYCIPKIFHHYKRAILLAPLLAVMFIIDIAASVGMDILRMLGKICKWMKCKLCNSASTTAPQVSSNILFPFVYIQQTNNVYIMHIRHGTGANS
jgi:hypothetical protein